MNNTQDWTTCAIASVDVETTGLDPSTDRVIEIAIIHMRDGEITDRWSSLVDPGCPIPEEVTRITGLKGSDIEGAPSFADIKDEVEARLAGHVFVAYNLDFDRAFIKNELERAGGTWKEVPYLDPLIFARELHRNQGSKRLVSVAERMGIEIGQAHRAEDDAVAAGHVLYKFAPQLPASLEDLQTLQGQWATQQENERAGWRNRRENTIESVIGGSEKRGNALGPAYVYGDETDPVRAMFHHLPDSGSRR